MKEKQLIPEKPHQLPIDFPPESRWSKRAGLRVVHCGCSGNSVAPPPLSRETPILLLPHLITLKVVTRGSIVSRSEETDGLAHRRLQVERLYVLPILLEQRHEEVDAQHDVAKDLVIIHLHVPDGDAQAKYLF